MPSHTSVVRRILTTQLMVTLGASALGWALGREIAYSVFLGGLVCLLPNAYFAARVFIRPVEGEAHRVVGSMYRAEVAKLVLAGVMFGLVFALVPWVDVAAFFIAYMAVHIGGVLGAFLAGSDSGQDSRAK